MGQWKSDLIVRWMSSKPSDQQRYHEVTVHGALSAGRERFITISSNKKGTIIYLEGKQVKEFPDVHLFTDNTRISNKIICLGNTPEATGPWLGELFGLALYNRELTPDEINQSRLLWMKPGAINSHPFDGSVASYTFSEKHGMWAHSNSDISNSIMIPSHLAFKKKFLIPMKLSLNPKDYDLKDVIINIFGFIPIGFIICLWLCINRKWPIYRICFIAIAIGIFLSLTIELLQGFLPTRTSSQEDLFCNTIGTMLGALLFLILFRIKQFLNYCRISSNRSGTEKGVTV